jgi:hypothetical protein
MRSDLQILFLVIGMAALAAWRLLDAILTEKEKLDK